jgi:hypothetical protein
MGSIKEIKVLKRWLILFFSALVIGVLSVVIDVTWIKKTLWIILLLMGFVASGAMYELYENNLDKLGKKKKDKSE